MQCNPEIKKRFKQLQLGVFSRKNSAFLAPLLCSLKVKFVKPEEVQAPSWFIMACDSDTLYINPDRLLTLSFKDSAYILEHELWHIARLHNKRRGNRDPQIWNEACDHVINLAMNRDGNSCSIPGLANPKYSGLSEEEIYKLLVQEQQTNPPPKEVPPSEQEGEDFSQDLILDKDSKQATDALANVARAKQQAQLSNGLEPGSIAGSLVKLWEKVLAPKLSWESILHNLMKDIIPKAQLSWKRRNRRFMDIHLPSMCPAKKRLSHLVYAIDTSGSVDENQLTRINSEIKYIHDHIKPKKLTVIQFDHILQHVDTFTDKDRYEKIELHGGGGTSYYPVKDFVDSLPKKPDGLIIFTDLYAEPMEPLKDESIPVFWIAVNTCLTESAIPFGTYIPVEI